MTEIWGCASPEAQYPKSNLRFKPQVSVQKQINFLAPAFFLGSRRTSGSRYARPGHARPPDARNLDSRAFKNAVRSRAAPDRLPALPLERPSLQLSILQVKEIKRRTRAKKHPLRRKAKPQEATSVAAARGHSMCASPGHGRASSSRLLGPRAAR